MSPAAVLDVLRRAGIIATPLEVAEALWLAQHLPPPRVPPPPEPLAELPGEAPPIPEPATGAPVPPPRPPASVPLATPSPSATTQVKAAPVRAPGPSGLANRKAIEQALRPLRRRAPSRRRQVLDERATVAYIAATGIWSPVLRPARERWFDAVLAVDTSTSMELWQHLGEDLRRAVAQTGAFRAVRLCRLTLGDDGCTVEIGGLPRSPRELIDGTGRRLFLVVTDAAANAWHDGTAVATLTAWGETGPVAVLQPLPEEMWDRTGLPAAAARLTSTAAGSANARLRAVYRRRAAGMPIPVLGIEPAAIGAWATLITRPSTNVPLAAAPAAAGPENPFDDGYVADGDALDSFRANASPEAYRLAVCLSLVPLTLPVMRLVQHVAVPGSGVSTLAEVVLGGLMVRTGPESYDFRDGVRDALAAELRRSEVATVLSSMSDWIAENAGLASRAFPAVLPSPDGSDTAAADPFVWVPPSVAARLGLTRPAPRAADVVDDRRPASTFVTIVSIRVDAADELSPVAATVVLRMALGWAGFPHGADTPLWSRDQGIAVALHSSVPLSDVVGRIFEDVSAVVAMAGGTTVMAVHESLVTGATGVDRLFQLLRAVNFTASAEGDAGCLIVSPEIRSHLVESGDDRLRLFARAPEIDALSPPAWVRVSSINRRASAAPPESVLALSGPLQRLVSFCYGTEPFLWVQGGLGAGKSPLLRAFAASPPAGIEVVAVFLDRSFDAGSVAFDLVRQLTTIDGTDLPALTRPLGPAEQLRLALAAVAARGRTVVVVVDGLDEAADGVAALLPPLRNVKTKVIVSSRPGYVLPPDHPVRHSRILELPDSGLPPAAPASDGDTLVLIELSGFGRNSMKRQAALSAGLSRLVADVLATDSGLDGAANVHYRGDGVLIVVSNALPTASALPAIVSAIRSRAESAFPRDLPVDLRVVVHKGVVRVAGADLAGRAVIDVMRTADAVEVRQALERQSFGLVLSDPVYNEVVVAGAGPGEPADYRRISFRNKEDGLSAWVYAPPDPGADLTLRTFVGFQVEGFDGRSPSEQAVASEALDSLLRAACARFFLPWRPVRLPDASILGIPATFPVADLVLSFPAHLRTLVRQRNAYAEEVVTVWMVAHTATAPRPYQDPGPGMIDTLVRLLDAAEVSGRGDVGLLVTDSLLREADLDDADEDYDEVVLLPDPDGGDPITVWIQTADEVPASSEEDQFRSMLGILPRNQRTVMELWLGGVSLDAIARQLNVNESTVRREMHRARATLRARLADRPPP